MANVPPHNSFSPNAIPSSQLPPGYNQATHNHNDQPTPPPIGFYGSKQNINSNSSQLPAQLQMGPMCANNLDSHSSSSSPAFKKQAIPPTSVPQLSQPLPQRPLLQQPAPQNTMPSTQYGSSICTPPVKPATSYTGGIPSTSTSFNPYPPGAGVGTPGIRPIGPSPKLSQHPPSSMTISSSHPSQHYSSQHLLQNGPLGNTNTATVGPTPHLRPSLAPQTSHYGPPATFAPDPQRSTNPTINGPPTSIVTGLPSSQAQTQIRQSAVHSGPALNVNSELSYGDSRLGQTPPGSLPSGPRLGSTSGPQFVSLSSQQAGMPSGSHVRVSSGHSTASGSQLGPARGLEFVPLSGQQLDSARGPQSGIGTPLGPPSGPMYSHPNRLPVTSNQSFGLSRQPGSQIGPIHGPQNEAPLVPPSGPPMSLHNEPPGVPAIGRPVGYHPGPPNGPPLGPPSGPTNAYPVTSQSSMSSRYPQNVPPQSNYNQSHQNLQSYSQQNGPQQIHGLTNQMRQMSVTQQGFNQMWGQQMYDLLQTRQILPEYPEDPPEIRLGQQFAESVNCSPDIFRCTINRIPETNSLLQKSRLPLGILINPFKDVHHLRVIQCSSIVRCRSCRTYINPFVYFVDSKRWKCNLCYRVNDLPEDFQYDPVSKSYGDPTRRPEIKSATVEFIAPGEYMLRPPQPAVYLFLLDVSDIACESGYLQVFCDTLKSNLEKLPGDARTQVGFICYDAHVHFYLLGEGLTRPREMTVIDIDDVFLPSPEYLLVNLGERREMITDLLDTLPKRHCEQKQRVRASALGAALQAAYKLMAATGGRVTVMQTCLPNVGPGALTSREDPNARSSKDVAHLNPATDFYKRLALECSGAQVCVDLFVVSSQYCDLATLSGISKFSGGSVQYIPLFNAQRAWQAEQLRCMLTRYLTRKIGFEAVMRVRCTRGITIHTFHGNFFVRSTDLLSLPNVSPDAGFGMQLTIEESLSDLQQVCFQAALLYTSSRGERRIRVHTLCLPVASNLTDIMHSADQQCIIGLLVKMAVDRAQQSTLSDAREALSNVAVDTLAAHRLAQNLPSGAAAGLHAPACLRLVCLYLSAALKHVAFRVGTSTRLDDRVAAMLAMKSLPLPQLLRSLYPDLYPIHTLHEHLPQLSADEDAFVDPPRLHLTAERINSNGAYLLDDGEQMIIYICSAVSPAYLLDTFGVSSYGEVADEARELPTLDTAGNELLHFFVEKLNEERPYASNLLILRDNSPSRNMFTERLLDDRIGSTFSYYEFLQHVKSLMK